mgnify:CR=1 FL=1
MTTVKNLTTAKLTVDEQVTGIQRLWLDNIVIAAPSWHVDFDGLITAPALQDHREDWLVDCCGGNYPDFSSAASKIVEYALSTFDEDIQNFFESDPIDRDATLLDRIQAQINLDAVAKMQSKKV